MPDRADDPAPSVEQDVPARAVPLAEHPFRAAADGYRVDNPVQRLHAELTRDGVRFHRPGAEPAWTWRLSHVGRAGRMVPLAPVEPWAEHDNGQITRVAYPHHSVVEWYVNGIQGLEQGFDVLAPPSGDGELVLRGAVSGAAVRVVTDTAAELRAGGLPFMAYAGLAVWDARGGRLPAHLRWHTSGVELVVDDAGATYPLTVDPDVGECPSGWCSDGQPSTTDVCNFVEGCDPTLGHCDKSCTNTFDTAYEGQACSWGDYCCADGKYHIDCTDPSIEVGQDCPAGWCSDGDASTLDACADYIVADGSFDCTNTFDPAKEGLACVYGDFCCDDGLFHADCTGITGGDGGGGGSTECPDEWCSDGQASTTDACSDNTAPGVFSCTFTFDPAYEGDACTWGTFCCDDGLFHDDCTGITGGGGGDSTDCPDSYCSDGDPSTADACDNLTAPGVFDCSYSFSTGLEGLPCTWGAYCCADGNYHADCSDPSIPTTQTCPDSYCSDGDASTVDDCFDLVGPGQFSCAYSFNTALDGLSCTWGEFCCADGAYHADCSDPSIPTGQDCPGSYCSDGDSSTIDACSDMQSDGSFTCANTFDTSLEGAVCVWGEFCCDDGLYSASCDDGGGGGTDLCPADPAKTEPGLCGCGVVEVVTDSDADGVIDCLDVCVGDDTSGDSDTDGVCNDSDQCSGFDDALDADSDGVPDGCDLCDGDDVSGDTDGDLTCDDIDPDADGNGCDDTANVPVLTLAGVDTEAVEITADPGSFSLTRSCGNEIITAALTFGGLLDATKGEASAADYSLEDASGGAITATVTLGALDTSVTVSVLPVADGLIEVPESLIVSLGAGTGGFTTAGTATIRITDAPNTTAYERLFVAQLLAEVGASTSASGLGSIRVQGDNDVGVIDVSFSGLTTTQTAAHVHVKNPIDGPIVQGLALGQVTDFAWDIRAADFLLTDQATLDALEGGQLYVNVHSEEFTGGEIRGDFLPFTGSETFTAPADPPALETLSALEEEIDLVRFLNQATFGATPASVVELDGFVTASGGDRLAGMEAWIDAQMDTVLTPSASHLTWTDVAYTRFSREKEDREFPWYGIATYGQDQLRQRMALALSEILVISDQDSTLGQKPLGMAHYQDMLAAGAFSPYRDLLFDVSTHPMMGWYLSHIRNSKTVFDSDNMAVATPDENYAREIMQLFTIGLVELHPDATLKLDSGGRPIESYDNTTIAEMSRVFTGYGFAIHNNGGVLQENTSFGSNRGGDDTQTTWMTPMKMFEDFHETGSKTVVGGAVVPDGQLGEADVNTVHDILLAHANTGPFISKQLIQRFVTSNPSRGYVYRVSQAWDTSSGDLGVVLKAILLDYEARSLVAADDVGYGKLREPLIRYVHTLRLTSAGSGVPLSVYEADGYPATETAKLPGATLLRSAQHDNFEQVPLQAPSVFNFFRPSFTPPGAVAAAGLVGPEFQITTELLAYEYINVIYDLALTSNGLSGRDDFGDADAMRVRIDPADIQAVHDLAATDALAAAAVVDHLDLYFAGGALKTRYASAAEPNPRSELISALTDITTDRVQAAIYLVTTSPQGSVQR